MFPLDTQKSNGRKCVCSPAPLRNRLSIALIGQHPRSVHHKSIQREGHDCLIRRPTALHHDGRQGRMVPVQWATGGPGHYHIVVGRTGYGDHSQPPKASYTQTNNRPTPTAQSHGQRGPIDISATTIGQKKSNAILVVEERAQSKIFEEKSFTL